MSSLSCAVRRTGCAAENLFQILKQSLTSVSCLSVTKSRRLKLFIIGVVAQKRRLFEEALSMDSGGCLIYLNATIGASVGSFLLFDY